MFFMLSGFLFSPDQAVKTFLFKKLKSIVIPYFCTGTIIILYELYDAATKSTLSWKFVVDEFLALLIQRRTWTIWFLGALLVVNLLLYFLKKLIKNDVIVTIISFAFAVLGLLYYHFGGDKLPWDIDAAVCVLPFFFGGYLIRKHLPYFREKLKKKLKVFILFAFFLAVNIITGLINYHSGKVITDVFAMRYGFAPLFYLSAFSGSIAVILFSVLVSPKPIRYIGKNSLTYFAFHQTIMLPVTYAMLSRAHITIDKSSEWWVMILYWILVLFIINFRLTIWNFVLTHTRFSFIVGKWKKKTQQT